MAPLSPQSSRDSLLGLVSAASAFSVWGLLPIYWKFLLPVPALEIITHRVVWSVVFLLILIGLSRHLPDLLAAFRNRRALGALSVSTILLAANWLIYIWAVNSDHVLQASLGYYINPLVNVLLGMIFLQERLRRLQAAAVLLAAAGVLILTVHYGQLPWIALTIAFSFGIYGLIRKVAPVGSVEGLTVETLLLTIPGLIYLIYLEKTGNGSFLHSGLQIDLLLIGTGPITAVPLLLFTAGARRIPLSTVGLLQYIAPSGMFLLAVFIYREPFTAAQVWTFVMIWTALGIYSADLIRHYRRYHVNTSQAP